VEKMPADADYGGFLVKILLKFGYKLQHTFEISNLKINLLKLHAPMSDERTIPNHRLHSGTVFPYIHL